MSYVKKLRYPKTKACDFFFGRAKVLLQCSWIEKYCQRLQEIYF